MRTLEEKRKYQKAYAGRYYALYKEKALAYQADRRIRESAGDKRKLNNDCPKPQDIKKRCFSIGDLTQAPVDKFQRQIEKILSGQMGLVG